MSLHPPASLFYHVYIVKGWKLNQRRNLQVTGLWLRSSKRKGRVETRESKRRYATPNKWFRLFFAGLKHIIESRLSSIGLSFWFYSKKSNWNYCFTLAITLSPSFLDLTSVSILFLVLKHECECDTCFKWQVVYSQTLSF